MFLKRHKCTVFRSKDNGVISAQKEMSNKKATHQTQKLCLRWQDKVNRSLEQHKRVMPNAKDKILVDGNPVEKCHLLWTNYQVYQKLNKYHSDSWMEFLKMIPQNVNVLDQACRVVDHPAFFQPLICQECNRRLASSMLFLILHCANINVDIQLKFSVCIQNKSVLQENWLKMSNSVLIILLKNFCNFN